MTELHIGLLAFGGVAVVGVLAYNKWQERKHRQVAEQMLRPSDEDVLLDGEEDAVEQEGEEEYAVLIQRDENGEIIRAPQLAQRKEPVFEAEAEPAPAARQEPVFNFDDEPAPAAEPVYAAEAPRTAAKATPQSALDFDAEPALAVKPAAPAFAATQAQGALSIDPIAMPLREAAPAVAARAPASEMPAPGEAEAPRTLMAPALPTFLLSPAADYIVALETVDFIPAGQFMQSQREALLRIGKRVTWVGLNEGSGEWEVMDENSPQEYRRLRIGVQLADRRGAISDAELSIFHTAMRQLAEEFMAVADLPTRKSALEDAYELDRFCADVDIQIGINVVAVGQLFPGTKIRALAEAAGMVLEADGAFVRRDDDGRVLYTLSHQSQQPFTAEAMKTLSCHGLTFLLDVPRVPNGDRVFNQMGDLARRFADSLHGVVVDDNRQPLTEALLEPIRKQVAQYQGAMAQRGLVAGGSLSLRLFA